MSDDQFKPDAGLIAIISFTIGYTIGLIAGSL